MGSSKKTLVLGASLKTNRYSNIAIHRLRNYDHEVVAVGLREGVVADVQILTGMPQIENLDTVTLYLNPSRQEDFLEYIINLAPQRIIYNPGTENPELMRRATEAGIENEIACTLVMLGTGQY